jgi:hypothetical protein
MELPILARPPKGVSEEGAEPRDVAHGSKIANLKLDGLLGDPLSGRNRRSSPTAQYAQASGLIFWFMRKKFFGSYLALIRCRRR